MCSFSRPAQFRGWHTAATHQSWKDNRRRSTMLPFHKINRRVIALLVLPTLLVAASDMAVARVDEAPSVTVRYHDLNLNTPEGIANLYERIHAAAVVVCKSVEG